jgi:glycosyltransferase involved in cell wall biosynthesis
LGARLISRVVDRQIATSHFVAESIGEPSIVILNGVPFNDRQPTPERNVLVAQRLEPEKCTDLAIQAWTRSKLMNEGWRLTIAGRGSQETTLIHLVASLGVQDSVDFVGVQADMRPLMSRASIFLATTPTESFGLSAVEAMAAGLPVVAARGGAHLETIGAADERWLFPVGDARVAAAMLDSLGDDAVERSRLSAGLRAWQREHLSIGTHVDQLEKVYEELRR